MPYLVASILVAATVAIAFLCWSWMQSTRASQRRTEGQNQRVIELLEELVDELKAKRTEYHDKPN